jgi:hypothetical protein
MFIIILISIISVTLFVLMLMFIVIETRRSDRRMHPNYYKNLDVENNISFISIFNKVQNK